MAINQQVIAFTSADTGEVAELLTGVLRDPDARGWINVEPLLDEAIHLAYERSWVVKAFSGRGPGLPMGTVTADGDGGAVVGIEHGAGPHALKALNEEGIALPDQWVKKQDHARRGIVVEVPPPANAQAVLDFILRASEHLSKAPLGLDWAAVIYRRD